jgi:hypothetical protein
VPEGPLQPFVQVMPEEYQGPDAIEAYRTFYLKGKARFAVWNKGRNPPFWWNLPKDLEAATGLQ